MKSNDVLDQIKDYLYETLKPLLKEDNGQFWDVKTRVNPYTGMSSDERLSLVWFYSPSTEGEKARFLIRRGHGGYISLRRDKAVAFGHLFDDEAARILVNDWKEFKRRLERALDSAFSYRMGHESEKVRRAMEVSRMLDEFEI